MRVFGSKLPQGCGSLLLLTLGLLKITLSDCCSDLYKPLKGILSGRCNDVVAKDQCIFSCVTGFVLVGDPVLTCMSNHFWDKSPPACTKALSNSDAALFCPALKNPANGLSSGKCGGPTSNTGDSCTFNCLSGFVLNGQKTLQCEVHGHWDSDPPHCVQTSQQSEVNDESTSNVEKADESCPVVEIDDNTRVFRKNERNIEGTIIYFSCLPGHLLEGKPSIRCESGGVWSAPAATCRKLASCPDLGPPQFGVAFGKVHNASEGDVIFFSCDINFQLVGKPSLKCQTDGQWDGFPASCEHDQPKGSLGIVFPRRIVKHVILPIESGLPRPISVESPHGLTVKD